MDNLLRFWQDRAPRERAILAAGTGVLLLALLYLMLIEPAAQGITRLERGLPQQRAQAAQLDALLSEVKALKGRAQVAAVSAGEARSEIEKTLAAAGLKASRISALSDGDLQLSFANVPYAAWSSWLAATERTLGVRTMSVVANATSTPGSADIEVALRLPRR